jgi:hypothetical protein
VTDLAAIHLITTTKYKYAYGIDTKDWDLYRSIFTDEIVMDFSSYSGQPKKTMRADDWVAGCQRLFTGLDASQHQMYNPLVDIQGDEARIRIYMQAEHFLQNRAGDASFTLGGWYDDRLVKSPDGWRITAVTLNVLWSRGNRNIMQLAISE